MMHECCFFREGPSPAAFGELGQAGGEMRGVGCATEHKNTDWGWDVALRLFFYLFSSSKAKKHFME